jgi:hypothetical protein
MGPPGTGELAASLKVTAAGEIDRPASVDVYGALLGTGSDATDLLDELVVRGWRGPGLGLGQAAVVCGDAAVLGQPAGA